MIELTNWLRSWLPPADKRGLMGLNARNVELVYALNPRRYFPLADDKLLCKTTLEAHGVSVPATLAVCDGLYSIPQAIDAVAHRGHFVLKPANGSGGEGVVLLGDRQADGWRGPGGKTWAREDISHHLANVVFGTFSKDVSDQALIEERVEVDPEVLAWCAGGVPDVRVLTHEGRPFLAMLRVPTATSGGRANLHQGAVGVAVELETGLTTRAQRDGKDLIHHPDTGAALVGRTVPRWEQVLQTATAAAAAVPLRYLGVDLLMDANQGPLVVEINARPGLEIQNVHGIGLKKALERIA